MTTGQLQERRERTFLVLAGIFLCAMTLLNVIGITRFVQLGPMALAVLKPGAFERLREKRIAAGGAANQIKTPHVIPEPGFLRRKFKHEILSNFQITGG